MSDHCAPLRLLAIGLLLALSSMLQAAPEAAADLEILQRRDVLIPLLSAPQKVALLKLEQQIERAQSELQSGQYLKQTRPSKLNPNQNVQAEIQRGEAMIARAQAEHSQAQAEIGRLLRQVEAARQAALNAETRSSLELPQADLPSALQQAAEHVVSACRAAGYPNVLFDRVFYADAQALTAGPGELNDQAYEALIVADGAHYAVRRPQDLKLSGEANEPAGEQFSYQGDSRYKDQAVALIAAEIIAAGEPSTQLLYLRALDIKSFRIIAQSLIELVEAEHSAPPSRASLIERGPWLSQLAQVRPAYQFQLAAPADDPQELRLRALATQLMLEHCALPLVDEAFVLRAYGPAASPKLGRANALLRLAPSAEAGPKTFSLLAQADGSTRILEIGDFVLE